MKGDSSSGLWAEVDGRLVGIPPFKTASLYIREAWSDDDPFCGLRIPHSRGISTLLGEQNWAQERVSNF